MNDEPMALKSYLAELAVISPHASMDDIDRHLAAAPEGSAVHTLLSAIKAAWRRLDDLEALAAFAKRDEGV